MWFFVSVILALLLLAAYIFVPWYYTHYLPTQQSDYRPPAYTYSTNTTSGGDATDQNGAKTNHSRRHAPKRPKV